MSSKFLIAEETREEKDKKKKDHESITRKYYTVPEEVLQATIKRAQKDDVVAQAELLKIFDNFLKKYVTLLYRKKADLRDLISVDSLHCLPVKDTLKKFKGIK